MEKFSSYKKYKLQSAKIEQKKSLLSQKVFFLNKIYFDMSTFKNIFKNILIWNAVTYLDNPRP